MALPKIKETVASSSIPLTRKDAELLFTHRKRKVADLAAEKAIKEREARRKDPAYDEKKEKARIAKTVLPERKGYNSKASTFVGKLADNVYHNSGAADAVKKIKPRVKRVVTGKQDPVTAIGGTAADAVGVIFNSAAKGIDNIFPGDYAQRGLGKLGETLDLGRWINLVREGKSPWDSSNNGFYDFLDKDDADYMQDVWGTALLAAPGIKRASGAKRSNTKALVNKKSDKSKDVVVPLSDGTYLTIPEELAAKLLRQQYLRDARQPALPGSQQSLPAPKTKLPSIEELIDKNGTFVPKQPVTSSRQASGEPLGLPAPKQPLSLPGPKPTPKRYPTIFINKERIEPPIWRWYEEGENGKLVPGEIMLNKEIGEANRTGTLQLINAEGELLGPFKGMGRGTWIEGRTLVREKDGTVRLKRPDEKRRGFFGARILESEKQKIKDSGKPIKLGSKHVYLRGYNPYGEYGIYPLSEYKKHIAGKSLNYEFGDPDILRPLLTSQFGGDVGDLTFVSGKYGDSKVRFKHPKSGLTWELPIQPKYIEGYYPSFNPATGELGVGPVQGGPLYISLSDEIARLYSDVVDAQNSAKKFDTTRSRPSDYFEREKAIAQATLGPDYDAILNGSGAKPYIDAISRVMDADAKILSGLLPHVRYRALNPLALLGVTQPSWIQEAALSTDLGTRRVGPGELEGGVRTLPVVTRKGSYHTIEDLSEPHNRYGGLFASEFDTLDDGFYMLNILGRLRSKFGRNSDQERIYLGLDLLTSLKHKYLKENHAFDPELDAQIQYLTEAYNASVGYDPKFMYKQHLIVPHTGKTLRLDAKGYRWLDFNPHATQIVTPDLLYDPLAREIASKRGNDTMANVLKRAALDSQRGTDINAIRIGNVHDGSYVLGQGRVTDIPAHAPVVKSDMKGRTPVFTSPEIPVGTELQVPSLIENSNIIFLRPGLHYDSNGRPIVTRAITSGEGYLPMYDMFVDPDRGIINYSGYRKQGGKLEKLKLFKQGGAIKAAPKDWEEYQKQNRNDKRKVLEKC